MTLVSCHVEHFGCLSGRTFRFREGLNPIQAPNGSGKTTLCEFLRAMFYGFPRTASPSLERNLRRRYLPWQGGLCGGSLVFRHQGVTYRVERTFGERPAQDTFVLWDLDRGQKSSSFSQDLGTELFGLDADSFARCTYLPQLGERGPAPQGIRTRLSNLVEDTEDTVSCDAALKLLRQRRAQLIPYRGQGGQVARARERISSLEEQLDRARGALPRLEQARQDQDAARHRRRRIEEERSRLQEQLRLASEATGRSALAQRRSQLEGDLALARRRLGELLAPYPQGLPDAAQVDRALEAADALPALEARLQPGRAVGEARAWLEERREEFQRGIPSEEAFARCREQCGEYARLEAERQGERLSREEERRLEELEQLLSPGIPDASLLERARSTGRRVQQLEAQGGTGRLLPQEEARFRRLEEFFAPGVPSREELDRREHTLERLRSHSRAVPSGSRIPGKALLALGAGAAALVGAVVSGQLLPAILLLIPALGLLGYGAFTLLQARRQTGPGREERELADWISRWFPQDPDPVRQLPLLEERREEFLTLGARREALARQEHSRQEQLSRDRAWLTEHLGPYFGTPVPPDAPLRLSLACRDWQVLQRKREETREEAQALSAQMDNLAGVISTFLEPYAGRVEPRDFGERLSALQRDCDACRRNRELLLSWESERTRTLGQLEQQEQILDAFSSTWGISVAGRADLEAVREAIRQAGELREEISSLEQALAAFQAEHASWLSPADRPTPEPADPGALRERDRQLEGELTSLNAAMAQREQQLRSLQEQTDAIPALEDELQRWRGIWSESQHTGALLDQTMDFLSRARDALSTRYRGALQERFGFYLQRLTREDPERSALDENLIPALERGGRLREAGSFSCGEQDLLQLCLRLALADALFPQVQPFLLLDDPFVNLDDRNTRTALDLLQDLARERQILYLYGHSSRALPEESG